MVTEWEHRRLRMTINDIIEQIKDIESVKVSTTKNHISASLNYSE